ncbi:ArsR/SmtB family transcription factor [Marinigracilibium pacificum]|uniref:Winged helix-turn-helix transcriptional regulator n=1 Tax=Marinigracilibium pacificum TaxID=2729599 RepID=A0A848J5Q4_9BACT|nr:metalloregulator ArsR/SmtB family transcription factor [Marinigracilibium pacificum]NMM49850.1 winged helix-turn-helix transcriptional regulator [Marinigracilibium pacificum]
MGVSKLDSYSKAELRIADLSKALGHPARIAILKHLLKVKQCINGELVNELKLAQATVSQHLSELKKAGIINAKVKGTSMIYSINKKSWVEMENIFNDFFAEYTG